MHPKYTEVAQSKPIYKRREARPENDSNVLSPIAIEELNLVPPESSLSEDRGRNDIRAKWTSIVASAEANEASQAMADFHAFVARLCTVYSKLFGLKGSALAPASLSIDPWSRVKRDAHAAFVRT